MKLFYFLTMTLLLACVGPEVETDVYSYQELREKFKREFVQHFPKALKQPENAQTYYSPAYMQGGTSFHLLYKYATKKEAEQEIERLRKLSIHQGDFDFITDSLDIHINCQMKFGGDEVLNDQYQLLIFQTDPEANSNSDWNHGLTTGAAFKTGTTEIFYWVEDW